MASKETRDKQQPDIERDTSNSTLSNEEPASNQMDVEGTSTSSQNREGSNEQTSDAGAGSSTRKKRFSSRNYRPHGIAAYSSSDDSSTENEEKVNKKKSKNNPPPPDLEDDEPDPTNELEEASLEEEDDSDISSSSSDSSSSDSNIFDTSDNDTLSDNDDDNHDEDVDFLNVERPKCTWFALRELFYREHGLSGNGRRTITGRDPNMFKVRVCGSLNVVERLELMQKMQQHDGCVNSLNFNHDGKLLASGSDDRQVILWNWASNTVATSFSSGHYSNVFQTRFYGGTSAEIRLVTSARDGLVRSFTVPSAGGVPASSTLFKHIGAVHRVAVIPFSPCEIMTAGEDGMVIHVDMRDPVINRLTTVKVGKRKVILYGIVAHPMKDEFCVYGQNRAVKIYDRRNTKTEMNEYYPSELAEKKGVITCATYNHLGTEILASYSDDDIYLFDRNDDAGHYQNRYRGHSNSQTIKGVNFFGAGSEFVVSGSDCGNIFFWDKKNGKIVQWMQADENGAINVLEPHPEFPILATSGLDSDVKIWVPSNEKPIELAGLEKCVRHNLKARRRALSGDLFDEDMFNLVVRERLRRMTDPSRDFVLTTELQTESDAEDNWENNNSSSDDEELLSGRNEVFPCSPM